MVDANLGIVRCILLQQAVVGLRLLKDADWKAHLRPTPTEPTNWVYNEDFSGEPALQHDQALAPILKQISKGFFVESGALTGDFASNTKYYEKVLDWTGLLVEPNPNNIVELRKLNRHANVFEGCLSNTQSVVEMDFVAPAEGTSSIGSAVSFLHQRNFKATCVPLGFILDALNRTTIDYWVLDVEGMEGHILKNFDFAKFTIGVLQVERGRSHSVVQEVMLANKFIELQTPVGETIQDAIYVNPQYFNVNRLNIPKVLNLPPGWAYHK